VAPTDGCQDVADYNRALEKRKDLFNIPQVTVIQTNPEIRQTLCPATIVPEFRTVNEPVFCLPFLPVSKEGDYRKRGDYDQGVYCWSPASSFVPIAFF